ncbi:MAG: PHB depolymerase family esterase [Sulfuritalea sp.]|nr:PHB depolymerase family esterase [Sulfuritalea sp.]MDP1983129.1 PHB depolymerase family esterase [Sulfuritalea sp.]
MHVLALVSLVCMSLGVAVPPAVAQDGSGLSLRERLAQRRAARQEAATGPLAGGTHTIQVTHEGRTRKVVVHVPAGLDSTQAAPLVLALHGGGGYAEYMADDGRYGLISKSDSAGFVVAFPNGYSKFPRGKFATWNAGGCCGDARDRKVDDVGFLRAVVAHLSARLKLDRARIYATGMSNGGMMSHRLACEAADLFAAVASVAGTEALSVCQPVRPIPVLHIHARNDTHVLFNGGAGKDAFRDESKVMDFVSAPETIARWVQRDQCRPTPRRVLETPGAYCEA